MSRKTLWPWKGIVLLKKKKKKDTITSAIQFALKNTLLLSQQQNQLSSAILTASYFHPQKNSHHRGDAFSNVTLLSHKKHKNAFSPTMFKGIVKIIFFTVRVFAKNPWCDF